MSSTVSDVRSEGRLIQWPWTAMVVGVGLALAVVALVTSLLMRPPFEELASLIGTLAATSVFSLAAGYLMYRRGWTRSPSLTVTLMLTYGWAAVLTLFNVWVMAGLMFINDHDLTLAGILLVFAAIIATSFGIFVSASVTDSLRHLAHVANKLATGDLSARATVLGRDEVAQVAAAFNEMADQLEQAAAKREEIETLRRDLIAWTSHDLRTPLTSIRVIVEALHDGVVTDEETRHRYVRILRSEVVALNDLIDDLFELAQLGAGAMVLELGWHSLGDLISDTLESLHPVALRRSVDLDGEIGRDVDPVLMNASKIGQVLNNLLGNALQHTPPGGRVALGARRVPEGVEVTVQDSGPGFTPEELPRVFEKFYRGEQARSRATGGAGLGLAIASGIVEAHGGRIWAENLPGKGALVGFLLPNQASHEGPGTGGRLPGAVIPDL